ncbi:MAG: hypothetical protein R2755_26565 [Acidimicrobiales bacterium]
MSGRDVVLIGARGGQGTSTVAALLALHSAMAEPTELITSDVGAMAALLGVPAPDDRGAVVSERLTITAGPISPVARRVYDGLQAATGAGRVRRVIGVLRGPCYLALRSLVSHPGRLDGIVVHPSPAGPSPPETFEDVTGVPVVAAVAVSPAVARTIDAGLLAARHAKLRDLAPLRRYAQRLDEPVDSRAPTAAGHPNPAALNRSGQLTVSRTTQTCRLRKRNRRSLTSSLHGESSRSWLATNLRVVLNTDRLDVVAAENRSALRVQEPWSSHAA